jgi:hypothetical protein
MVTEVRDIDLVGLSGFHDGHARLGLNRLAVNG